MSASEYKGMSYPRLLIRSINELYTPAEQHRRWINDMPCRRTEILPEKEWWIEHLEQAKEDLIPLEELDNESAEMSVWYHMFLIEVGQLNKNDVVFI